MKISDYPTYRAAQTEVARAEVRAAQIDEDAQPEAYDAAQSAVASAWGVLGCIIGTWVDRQVAERLYCQQ